MLDSKRTFKIKLRSRWAAFEISLTSAVFAFKEFCKEKRLSNIFKTTNVTKLTKANLKRVLQEFPFHITCMVFEEINLSGYIAFIS